MTYTLVVGGDVLLVHPVKHRDPSGPWPLSGLLDGPGDVFVNVEQVLTDSDATADKIVCMKGPPESAGELRDGGVGVVTLANNHSLDYGTGGLADTIAALDAAGVEHVGAGASLEAGTAPVVREHGAHTVAFFGVTCAYVPGAEAATDRAGMATIQIETTYVNDVAVTGEAPGMVPFIETVADADDVARLAAGIAAARAAGATLVVIGMHWGVPHGCLPPILGSLAQYQQPLGHALIDAGADVIVGHHPHFVHPVEIYNGKPILYSLGDLLMHRGGDTLAPAGEFPAYDWTSLAEASTGDAAIGLIARLTWPGGDAAATPGVELLPVRTGADGEPRWLHPDEADRVTRLVQGMGVEVSTASDGDRVVLAVAASAVGP